MKHAFPRMPPVIQAVAGSGRSRSARRLIGVTCAVTVMFASGCASTDGPFALHGVETHGGWLELTSDRVATVGSGVELVMPNAPYRARFADSQGIYYQASLPLVYRSAFGIEVPVTGGLYVPYAQPDRAHSWSEPAMTAPLLKPPLQFSVRLHGAKGHLPPAMLPVPLTPAKHQWLGPAGREQPAQMP